jgi:hypothetical protein
LATLRLRLRDADALNPSELHSFKELMQDLAHVIPDTWYWDAFEELDALGHLNPASSKANLGDAVGRLSAEGRYYLRGTAQSDE